MCLLNYWSAKTIDVQGFAITVMSAVMPACYEPIEAALTMTGQPHTKLATIMGELSSMLRSMICAGLFLTATAMGANAATFSYDYEVTSPSFGLRSIIGDFSTNTAGALTSLTGTVSGGVSSYNITNLLFGTYDQAGQVLDVAFQIGGPNYELRSTRSSAFLTAEISSVGTISIQSVSAVPLPASAPLFGAGLLALATFGYRGKRSKSAA